MSIIPENNLQKIVKYSLLLVGAAQTVRFIFFSLPSRFLKPILCKPLSVPDGKRQKWAFVLNSTSCFGRLACEYLAARNYNLIMASFEADRLDEAKAELFLRFPGLNLQEYYFYKGDMKNFEEKFHFRDFLEKFEVEVFVLNDCLGEGLRRKEVMDFGYEELQFELSKKFLLKTFLVKIILENRRKRPEKTLKSLVFNVNDEGGEGLLGFKGFEEFLKGMVEAKYRKELNVEVANIFNDVSPGDFETNEAYRDKLRARFFR